MLLRFYRAIRTKIISLILPVRVVLCKIRYWKVLVRIRHSRKVIRVIFIVSDIAKWKCQTLFDKMKASDCFEPLIVLSPYFGESSARYSESEIEDLLKVQEKFFDDENDAHVRSVSGYPPRYNDLSVYKPDIVFFQEPWTMNGKQTPWHVSNFAIACYVPYYIPHFQRTNIECQMPMHRFLHSFFVLNEETAQRYEYSMHRLGHAARFVPSGHPALDGIMFSPKPNIDGWVIYAPHWSIDHPEPNSRISTFKWSGRAILEYAKAHREFRWLFKPHPVLKRRLIDLGYMTKEEVDAYYSEWELIGKSCYTGAYQKYFNESYAMITDCGSFITEYPKTGRPLIHLRNAEYKEEPCCKLIYETFYHAYTKEEMLRLFHLLLEQKQDPIQGKRLNALQESGISVGNASENIYQYLRQLCQV